MKKTYYVTPKSVNFEVQQSTKTPYEALFEKTY